MKSINLLINEKEVSAILKELTKIFGLPEIERSLVVYAYKKHEELHLRFANKKGFYKLVNKNSSDSNNKEILLANKNVKEFFKFIKNLGFNRGVTNSTIMFAFIENGTKIQLIEKTFLGALLKCSFANSEDYAKISAIINKFGLKELNPEEVEKSSKVKPRSEELFNDFGGIHSVIRTYLEYNGINISNQSTTLQESLNNLSNDYSEYEQLYNLVARSELVSQKQSFDLDSHLDSVSIIIPSYNSEKTIVKTLKSIEIQKIDSTYLDNKVEVIVLDDGSDINLKSYLEKYNFKIKIKVIRFEENQGRSVARNVGYLVSSNSICIFLDSDIILPSNYLRECVTRASIIPNAIFFAFKKNILEKSEILTKLDNGQTIESDKKLDDLRIKRDLTQDVLGIESIDRNITTEILSDSNYFKNFGFGRKIGIFDLPATVISHNLIFNRTAVEGLNKLFHEKFKGWGMEDAYFGARVIANGNFIIPIISTNVYHIDHPPRSGSEEQKKLELERNLNIYKELLNQTV